MPSDYLELHSQTETDKLFLRSQEIQATEGSYAYDLLASQARHGERGHSPSEPLLNYSQLH